MMNILIQEKMEMNKRNLKFSLSSIEKKEMKFKHIRNQYLYIDDDQ